MYLYYQKQDTGYMGWFNYTNHAWYVTGYQLLYCPGYGTDEAHVHPICDRRDVEGIALNPPMPRAANNEATFRPPPTTITPGEKYGFLPSR